MKKLVYLILCVLLMSNLFVPAFAAGINNDNEPEVNSETAVLLDAATGQVLYQKDMDKQMYPASITKVMTGLLALKKGDLTDLITMSGDAVDSVEKDTANIALCAGEEITMEQALYAISIASANEAANGIAEAIGGTLESFIDMMNTAAMDAGAENTHFNNANGLPDDDHVTTAHDMALIAAEAVKTPGFTDIFGTRRYTIPPTNLQPETRIINSSNRFLNGAIHYEGMLFSKAGWTEKAQHTLVTAAQRNGITLVVVVMKSTDSAVKWEDTTTLLDYGFNQFTPVTLTEGDILEAAPSDMAVESAAVEIDPDTYEAPEVTVLLPKDALPENITIAFGDPQPDARGQTVRIPVEVKLTAASAPVQLAATTVTAALRAVALEEPLEQERAKPGVFIVILIALGSLIGLLLLAFVFLVIRRAIIVRRRRRRKLEQRRRMADPYRRRY